MSAAWQHVHQIRGDVDYILTDGLYDAAANHWVIRSVTIGGLLRVGVEDAQRIQALYDGAERKPSEPE